MSVLGTAQKVVRVLRQEGTAGVAERLVRRAAQRWGGSATPLNLRPEDIVDSATVRPAAAGRATELGRPLFIGWVISAPGPASGGHTTIFRFVEAAEAAGHHCVLFVQDGHDSDGRAYEQLIRTWWPGVKAEVRAVRDGMAGMDAYVATAWPTAHVLAKHSELRGARFYLIQDFEPYFYPRGSAYELAEDTYRFGFLPIAVGHMVAGELRDRFGVESVVAEFGCDAERYHVTNRAGRDGVVFYAKPGIARRGYEMGVLALQLFNRARPEVPIHTFGIVARKLPFPATVHAHLAPAQLNALYNQCGAGLALSFTNISLIANELLAAGVVPVVNDYPGTRADLTNPHVSWAKATPDAIARSLADALEHQREVGPDALRKSVESLTWAPAQSAVVHAIENECARVSHSSNPMERS